MNRGDWAAWIVILAGVVLVVIAIAICISVASESLACGDRGGDIFWGTMLRHVCIGHDGQVLP